MKLPALILGLALASCAAVPSAGSHRVVSFDEGSIEGVSIDAVSFDATVLEEMAIDDVAIEEIASTQASTPEGRTRTNRVSAHFGERQLDEDDYEPLENQPTFGVLYSQEHPDWVVGWEAGGFVSGDSDEVLGVDITALTAEVCAGVRKSFGSGTVRPYVGAGVSYITVISDVGDIDDDVGEEHDSSFGLYAHGGVDFQISQLFSLGLDVRGLFGTDVELYGFETDADYVQFAVVAGFSF